MCPTTYLEWWHQGEWRRIGWDAHDLKGFQALFDHGARLAAQGGHYRLTQPSVYADAPPTVVHEFPVVVGGAA